MRLIIEEAAAILKARADHVLATADASDYKSRIAAMVQLDHVKKLAWVYELLEEPTECKMCMAAPCLCNSVPLIKELLR